MTTTALTTRAMTTPATTTTTATTTPAHLSDANAVFAGTMDVSQVRLPDDARYYLCGPLPFMQAVRAALIGRGVRPQDIQYEVFGPDLWQADFD